ncbi:translocation/assembly module TamB [Litchfieldella qijiaojingensis]|uniref:Translocation/assembly module TamB n=1 Tax=Litchfieldella qijiaojingensis TaxID=980347 RepID=A0ABQ2YC88_9GAMM|nr:translocation/assembly module TamB [Halomonas qijiaojingensis]
MIWALLRTLIWLPLWLLGLVILALGLALSPWGTGILLEEGQARGWYEVESVEGAPLDRLELRGFRIDVGPTSIALDRFVLDWAEDCVLRGRLCIDELAVAGARIRLAEDERALEDEQISDSTLQPASIELPFPFEIRALSLTDVDLRLADGTRLSWEQFRSGAEVEGSTLNLTPTLWRGGRLSLPLTPGTSLALTEADLDGNESASSTRRLTAEAIDAAIAVRSPLPGPVEVVPLAQRERLSLPEIHLPLAIEVPSLVVEDFRVAGPFEYGIERLALTLDARDQNVRIEPLNVTSVDADAELTARIELRDDYPLEARLTGTLMLPEIMPELAGERLALQANGSLSELVLGLDAEGPVTLALKGHLDALDPTLPFTATLRADELTWPLADTIDETVDDTSVEADSAYHLRELVARLEGSLLDYQAALSVRASGPEVPETRLALTGSGDWEHFAWAPISLALEQGSLISHGDIRWGGGLAVRAGVRMTDLDPGLFTDAVSGRLSGSAELSFRQDLEGWRLAVPELAVHGQLQDLPMALDAQLTGNSDMQWQVERLDFRQGDNRLRAQGRVGERLALSGDLEAPALEALSPQLAGMLRGEFNVAGTLEAPQVELDLQGEELRLADTRLERLDLVARVSGLNDPNLDVRLQAERLNAGGQRFRTVSLALDGRLSEHRLTLDAQADQAMPLSRIAMVIEGGMNTERSRYRGQLATLEVDSEHGDLRLISPMAFAANLDTGSVTLQPFCLRRLQGGELCANDPIEASATRGRAMLALRELPMDLLDETVPEDWELDGDTHADIIVEWRQGGVQWSLDARFDSELALSGLDAYGQPWALPESRISLTVEATQARADANLEILLSEAGRVRLEITVDEPMAQGDLSGRLIVDDIRLSPYRTLVAGMERMRGGVSGDVAIGGDLQAPMLDGEVRLSGLQVQGGVVPMVVRDGELSMRLNGDRGTIDGFIAAEQGRLMIDGDAAWPTTDAWEISMSVDGRDDPLLAVLPEFGRLRLAPDLRIDIDPSLLRVRGRVAVPWARLVVGRVPASAITPSSDEVIITRRDEMRARREAERAAVQAEEGIDETTAKALARTGMAIDVQIDLILGPDMQLEAYGLEAGLRGSLEVRQGIGPVQLFGYVNLIDGRFRAFGQDLLIRQGQLFFSGPAGQPLLQFEAIRNPNVTADDVVAGLRVSGPAEAPNLQVFSEPAMDEARALSYLLRGRAPEEGDADGALTSALIGLSLSRTGSIVGQLGEAFGIQDLTLESAGTGDESQVVVSGYLFEDLRVSYGVGIFSPIAELTLRYTLWRNLYLQVVSGAAQAVDLVYSFSLGRAQ